ncbi:tetratricopeptide repeat protein [Streptomyces subrutilus]|uniref:tetratricopeptide repeat protein n=1 Tax=Streptomyces subrutilus TaxID=36818 RepID=UPI0033D8DA41
MSEQHVSATGGFAYGVVGADIHVFGDGTPLYVLRRWASAPEADPQWLRQQPSRMLHARFAVAPFTGREDELGELHAWCAGGPRRAARWLHAPGGQGKTRLAQQLAAELSGQGWKVVTAVEGPGTVLPPPGSQDLTPDGAAGLLLLVDYADRWPLTTLTWLFSNALLHRPDVRARVLLLARDTHTWPALRGALASEQIDVSTQALGPLDEPRGPAAGQGERGAMFRAARAAFAERYGIVASAGEPDLADDDFGLVLAVHMAALVAVDAAASGRRAPPDLAGLTLYLLDREHLGWALLHDRRGAGRITLTPAVMNRVVFTASLSGAQPQEQGAMLVDALEIGQPTPIVLADHGICYPAPEGAEGTVLEPLYPDRLAEDFVALTVPGHEADYPAQAWAADTAGTVLRHGSGPARAVPMLVAAAGRWPHLGPACLYPLLAADPGLGVAAGGAALTALAELPDITTALLEEVAGAVPDPAPANLVVGLAAVNVRLFASRIAAAPDRYERAWLYAGHGNDLHELGRTEEALRAARRGVELFRELAADDPETYEEHVGRSSTNVASLLHHTGEIDEAVTTQQSVVDLFTRLALDDSRRYEPYRATALANVSVYLESAGRWEEAYRANQEAASAYRRAAVHDPAQRRGLAIALSNGAALTFRQPAEDVALREAVELARELVREGALVEDTPLVASLERLRDHLSARGRPAEAVAPAREVAELNRRLAEADPHRYTSSWTTALMSLHGILLDADRPREAVEVGEEAVTWLRRLADRAPATYMSSLGGAVSRQNTALRAVGLPPEPEVDVPRVLDPGSLGRLIPGARIAVDGWFPELLPVPHVSATVREDTARGLARRRDWPAYWELVRSAPLADAVHLVRRIPRRAGAPDHPLDAELFSWLRSLSPRRTRALVDEAARAATRTLHEDFGMLSAARTAFGRGGEVLAIAHVTDDPDEQAREVIETLEPKSGTRTVLHRGPVRHQSLAVLGPADVVALRRSRGYAARAELVRHTSSGTRVLAQGRTLTGAHLAATAYGCVISLPLMPQVLVLKATGELHQVDLGQWTLSTGGPMAVTPRGDRMVLCDGYRLIAVDAALGHALAGAPVPADHAPVRELVFAGEGALVTAGWHDGLVLWQLGTDGMRPVASRDTPMLSRLCAVPAWGVVSGHAGSEGRIRFFDPWRGLAPVDAPPAIVGPARRLRAVLAAPGGRHVVYSGQLDVDLPPQRRSFAFVARVHDLHHPGSLLRRAPAGLGDAERAALARAYADDPGVRDLLRLAHVMATRF